MVITSRGTGGLSGVPRVPATLAQQVKALPKAVMVIEVLLVLVVVLLPPIAMQLPSGPETFAVRIMRVYGPAGAAVTFSSGFELTSTISASRTVVSVSVDWIA